jgi:hypothetical protein
LARLCERDLPYLWICGEVGVNYHLLSDFRTDHGGFLDELLMIPSPPSRTRNIDPGDGGSRWHAFGPCGQRIVSPPEVFGRLSPGSSRTSEEASRRERGGFCERCQQRTTVRLPAAAAEREQRVEAALKNLAELQQQKSSGKKGSGEEARCSTTDPKPGT